VLQEALSMLVEMACEVRIRLRRMAYSYDPLTTLSYEQTYSSGINKGSKKRMWFATKKGVADTVLLNKSRRLAAVSKGLK
jgi:hypothetical protein